MTGHFKDGVWIEDKTQRVDPEMHIKLCLDTFDAEASLERFRNKLADLVVVYEQFAALVPEE